MKRFIIILFLAVGSITGLVIYASLSDVDVETKTVTKDISDRLKDPESETALPQ